MYISLILLSLTLSTATARYVPDKLEARDDVALCQAALVALKASKFCSSFVPITDTTSTVTQPAPTISTVVTVTSTTQCAAARMMQKEKRDSATKTSSSTSQVASTKSAPTATSVNALQATTKAQTTTSAKACNIAGLAVQLNVFACDVITKACIKYVKPTTTTITTALPATTIVSTASATTCTTAPAPPPCVPSLGNCYSDSDCCPGELNSNCAGLTPFGPGVCNII